MTFHFGLLLLPLYQWIDAAAPIDFLNTHSEFFIRAIRAPPAYLAVAPKIVWHYISHDLSPVQATSGPAETPTTTYADCPPLDYLLVPGPDPEAPLPAGCAEFLKERLADPQFKALLTVCTGSMSIAQGGVLDGYRACSNKYALQLAATEGRLNKNVQWVVDRRWVVDGKVWSSGGITAGLDLAAEFARVHFDPALVAFVNKVAEYEPKPAQPDPFARTIEPGNPF